MTATSEKPERLLDLDVVGWRYDQLERAGYPLKVCILLAESNVDLHLACELLEQGATLEQAVRILL